MTRKPKNIYTKSRLTKCGKYWQKILRLQDWDVEFKWAKSDDLMLGVDNEYGEGELHPEYKKVHISIVHPSDYTETETQDIELAILHEVYHSHLAVFSSMYDPGTPGYILIEQIINATSKVILGFARGEIEYKNFFPVEKYDVSKDTKLKKSMVEKHTKIPKEVKKDDQINPDEG